MAAQILTTLWKAHLVQVTDFVIILHSKTALDAFSKGGNLTLGGNLTVAAGR